MEEVQSKFQVLRPVKRSPPQVGHLRHVPVVTSGTEIAVETGYVRGHGTILDSNGKLRATVSGTVERVNKLVAVRALRARYVPEVGDVVVGRVVEIAGKRWKMDINARFCASLQLSAVNLPGGVQRRRTYEDELNMRMVFEENDLISAEVQELRHGGNIALHTRSLRYGKLTHGQFVKVAPALVKRSKKHFHHLVPCDVSAILGNNGYIFLWEGGLDNTENGPVGNSEDVDMEDADAIPTKKSIVSTAEGRKRVARVKNAMLALNNAFIAIHPETIIDVYDTSLSLQVAIKDMTRTDISEKMCVRARSRRQEA